MKKCEAVGLMALVTVVTIPLLFGVAGGVKETRNQIKGKRRTCRWWNCPSGRECEVQADGSERCVCASRCNGKHKPVCGTDGQLYVNHCELHRTACLADVKIKIDWDMTCLKKNVYEGCPMEKLTELRNSILTTFRKELDKEVTSQILIDELYFRYNRDGDHSISASEIKSLVNDYVIYPNIKELAKACDSMQWFKAEDKDENGFLSKEEFSGSFVSKPVVKIQKQSAQPTLGTNLTLQCQAQGYPVPVISWLKDQKPLKMSDRVIINAGGDLIVVGLQEEDTGAYACEATNDKGSEQKYVAVEVQKPVTEARVTGLSSIQGGNVFFVFGSDGVHVIDPETSSVVSHIPSDDVISGMTSPICTEGRQRKCNWGGAVNVNSKYIYVADFLGHRVLVLDVAARAFVQEVTTGDYPYQLKYFRSLDAVWVLCWGNSTLDVLTEDEDDNGTLAVIGQASKSIVHSSIKAQIGDGYTKPVHGFFEAENCALKDVELKLGYVTHIMEPGFHEVDLVTKQYSRFLNLSGQCYGTLGLSLSRPQNYAFVQCYTSKELDLKAQVVVDTKNDQIVSINSAYFGLPFASPDGQFVITLNFYAILTQYIDPVGNIHRFPEIKSTLLLSNLAFYPRDAGYDVYVTSKDQGAIIVLHVDPSGIETLKFISSVGKPSLERDWVHTERPIVIGCDPNVNYLATPATADDAVIILDGQQQEMRGRVKGIKGARTIVWVPREPVQ